MFLAVIRVWHERRSESVPLIDAIGRLDWLWWCCAALAFTAVTFWVGLPNILQTVFGLKAYAKQFLYGLTAFFLLLPAVFGPQDRGVVRRFLQWCPVAYLGTISYGIYLWHQAFIKKVHQWGGWTPGSGEPAIMSFRGNFAVHVLAALALSALVASASWYLVERPVLRRKHRPLVPGRG
jgi:peptidoglycan/LPS O-acetylase OafA/YrhL